MRFSLSNMLKLAVLAGVLAIGGLLAASPAQAAKYSNWQDAAKHFEQCATWLTSDPAKHAQFCDPGHVVFANATGGDGNVTPQSTTKPPCHPCPPPPCHPCPPHCHSSSSE